MDHKLSGKRLNSSEMQIEEVNISALPSIKQQGRRNISQIRRDEGEYSRLLSNKNNNRLVQAQNIINDALRKNKEFRAIRNERNSLGKYYFDYV